MNQLISLLETAFGADRVKRDAPLAPLTTFKVGGPADILLETQNADEIVQAVQLARAAAVKVTMIGGGSNVLIADDGIRGLVIRARSGEVTPLGDRLVRAHQSNRGMAPGPQQKVTDLVRQRPAQDSAQNDVAEYGGPFALVALHHRRLGDQRCDRVRVHPDFRSRRTVLEVYRPQRVVR